LGGVAPTILLYAADVLDGKVDRRGKRRARGAKQVIKATDFLRRHDHLRRKVGAKATEAIAQEKKIAPDSVTRALRRARKKTQRPDTE